MGGDTVISILANRSRKSFRQRCGDKVVSARLANDLDASHGKSRLKVQLPCGQDDVLAGRLDESLDTRVCLVEKAETLDELRHLGRIFRFKGDSDDRRRL